MVARDRFWGLTEDVVQEDMKRSAAAAAAAPAAAEREAMTRSLVEVIALGRWGRGAPEAPSGCGGGTGWIWSWRLGWGRLSAGNFGAPFAFLSLNLRAPRWGRS